MKVFSYIIDLLKGAEHAGRIKKGVSGGRGRNGRVLHQINAVRERAVSDFGGIRMLAKACADERGGDSGEMPPDPVRETSRRLITAAKKLGLYVDVNDVPGTRYTIR